MQIHCYLSMSRSRVVFGAFLLCLIFAQAHQHVHNARINLRLDHHHQHHQDEEDEEETMEKKIRKKGCVYLRAYVMPALAGPAHACPLSHAT